MRRGAPLDNITPNRLDQPAPSARLTDAELIVPGDTTARIQEAHLLLYHSICELLDPVLADTDE